MSVFNPEASPRFESQEGEPKQASIRLEFFRHDAKTKEATSGPREGDTAIRLTLEGRQHATDVGKNKNPYPETSVAYGSPRERAQETALRHMLANDKKITGDASLEEIRGLISDHVKHGRKEKISELLDFKMEGNPDFNKIAYDHYLNRKDLLDWMRNDSDELIRQLKDTESSCYSRMAGNVAELVQKYVRIYPRWRQVIENDPQKYAQFDNELQRHFGSHQGVTESFLLKVVEKTEGKEGAAQLIDSLASRNGFDFSEGFSVQILDIEHEQQLIVKFRDKEWQTSPAVIDEIIDERDKLNESTNANGE